jgi:hypothetical protein
MNQDTLPRSEELFLSSRTTSGQSFTQWKSFAPDLSAHGDSQNPMTAGMLGKKFRNAVDEASDLARPLVSKMKDAARAFIEFVDERNELVHAHVYSEANGRQQLIYQGRDKTRTLSIAEIDDLAHRSENSSVVLRDLMKEIWNVQLPVWRNDGPMPFLATVLITLLLAVPAMSVEMFRYRGAAKRCRYA